MTPIASALLGIGGKLIERVFPDKQAQAEAKLRLIELEQTGELERLKVDAQLALAQTEVNKAEALAGGIFRGGWRPAVGWVCSLGLLYQFFIRPLLPWFVVVFGVDVPELPKLEMDTLMALLFGILGLGGYRTYEKSKGLQ